MPDAVVASAAFPACTRCELLINETRRNADEACQKAKLQLQMATDTFDVRQAAAARRETYLQGVVDSLMHETQRLRGALDNPDSAARNGAYVKRTIEQSLDSTSAARVAELMSINSDLTVDRNRILAELNRLKTAHARELADLQTAHEAVVKDLEAKLLAVNDMLHHSKGMHLVKRLAEYNKELLELREALFVMQQEVRKTKLFNLTEKPFENIAHVVQVLGTARDKAEQERNGALLFVNRVRHAFSDLWCGTPQLDHLRKDLGRSDDATKIVDAVRQLTALYLDVVTAKLSKPCRETQCNFGLPEPVPVTNAGCQTPAEWAIAPAAASPPPRRRTSAAPSPGRRPTVSSLSDVPSSHRQQSRLSIDSNSAPQRPLSRPTSASRRTSFAGDVGGVSEGGWSDGEGDSTIDEETEEASEDLPAPAALPAKPEPIDDEALHTAVDAFYSFRAKRCCLARWLKRFHKRQVARLEDLLLKKIAATAVREPRKPPVPQISSAAILATARSSALDALSGRTSGSAATREDRPQSARLGTWVALSQSTAAKAEAKQFLKAGAVKHPPQRPSVQSEATLTPRGSSALQTEFGGGWRYGHVRTVMPAHRPMPRRSFGAAAAVDARGGAMDVAFEALVDATAIINAMTPRSEMVHMTTATLPASPAKHALRPPAEPM